MIQKILSQLFLVCIAVALQICIMIFGWGLHPQSWWWLVGGGVFGVTAVRALSNKLDKEPVVEPKEDKK